MAAAAAPAKRSYFWPVVAGGVVVVLALALFWPSTVTAPEEAIESIAVLPFENRSGDPEFEYVSDGITEGITHRLSQLPSLDKVISSSSVRGYKGKEVDAQTVARELDVRAVVIASMVQSGENIRLSVELVDGKDNNILWGNNYIRPRSSLYEMEEYLSMEIADAMGIQLTGEEGERLTRRYTEDSEAHDAYLKGQAVYAKGTSDGYLGAISYFEKAIEQDSDYAPAYAALGRAYYVAARGAGAISYQEAMPRAAAAAEQAVELDNTLGLAHAVLGDVQRSFHWDFLEA
ncbi:MAG TPA: hypothetical protein EYN18_01990, partial [Nitrospirales bacterium]|nr:hypothetical protein [Nitrospirales bacterium]